jgi:chromate reductase
MISIIAATNRPNSSTLKLAGYYQRRLAAAGAGSKLLSLTELPADLMATDLYGMRSEAFTVFQDWVDETDKFIFIIPEYNGSFPGVLKLFIDACRYPGTFSGKKCALVGHSSGKYGNIRGLDHFTGVCHYVNMLVLPMKIHIPFIHKELDADDNLFQPDTMRFTDMQIEQFLAF